MKIHRCELLSNEGCAKKMKRSECTKECIQLALLSRESRKRNISEQKGDKIYASRRGTRNVTAMHAKLIQLKLLKKLSQQSKTSSMLRLLHQINVKTMDDRITRNILLYNLTVLIHHSSLRIRQRVSVIFKKLCKFLRFSIENENEEQCNAYKNTHARVPNEDKPFDLLRLFKKNNNVTDGALIFALEDTDPQVRTNALNAIFQLSYIHRLSSLAFSFYLDMLFDPDTAISTLSARYVHRLTKMYDITVSKHNLEHLFIVVTRCNDTVRKYIIKTIGNLVFDEQTIDCLSVCISRLDIKYLIYCAEKVVGNNTELVRRAVKKWSDKKAEDEDKKENNIEMNEKDANGLERMQNGSNEGDVKDESENDVDEGIADDEQAYNEVVDHHDENSTRVISEVDHVSDPLPVHTMDDNSSINRSLFKENNLGQSLFAFFLGPSNDYLQVFVQMNKHKSKNIQKRERAFVLKRLIAFLREGGKSTNYFKTCKNYIYSDTPSGSNTIVKDDKTFFTFVYDVYTSKKNDTYHPLLLSYNLASLGVLTFAQLQSFISDYKNLKSIRRIVNVFDVPSTVRVNDVRLISFTVLYEGQAFEHLFVRIEYKSVIFLKCKRSVNVRMRYEGRGDIKVGLVVRIGDSYTQISKNRRIRVVTGG